MPDAEKILIVDDDGADRELVRIDLINVPCIIQVADNLEEAIIRTESFDPELIFLDVNIPRFSNAGGISNFEDILDFIKRFKNKRTIIILTGYVNDKQAFAAMGAGACDYLSKDILKNRIEFEARLEQARSLRSSQDSVMGEVLRRLALLRIGQETVLTKQDQAKENTGKVQEGKDKLLKEQAYQRGRDDERKLWRKWIFALWNIVGWAIIGVGKMAFERFFEKH